MQSEALGVHQLGRPTFRSQPGVEWTERRFLHQEEVTGQVQFGTCVCWNPGRRNSGRRPRWYREISKTGGVKLLGETLCIENLWLWLATHGQRTRNLSETTSKDQELMLTGMRE